MKDISTCLHSNDITRVLDCLAMKILPVSKMYYDERENHQKSHHTVLS